MNDDYHQEGNIDERSKEKEWRDGTSYGFCSISDIANHVHI